MHKSSYIKKIVRKIEFVYVSVQCIWIKLFCNKLSKKMYSYNSETSIFDYTNS